MDLELIIGIIVAVVLVILVIKIVKKVMKAAIFIALILIAFTVFAGVDIRQEIAAFEKQRSTHVLCVQSDRIVAGVLKTNTTIPLETSEVARLDQLHSIESLEEQFNSSHRGFLVYPEAFDDSLTIEFDGVAIDKDQALLYIREGVDRYAADIIINRGLEPDDTTIEFIKRGLEERKITEEVFPSHLFGLMIQTTEQETGKPFLRTTLRNGTTELPKSFILALLKNIPVGDSWWVYSKN